ncbi:AraC-like DNA-binding protein [Paenibacillus phyllosphaerae]|uniref:AraC-like DNA-binding protein n=1 Tax=Paenibacillus phyllosphaerae TaxID=274593 RepID=A0A7W5AWS3_9BACL|nr:AraC family transcriptional regulator [Paenibacillus phyllosphaerae]MBB3110220.1 AraC-like DNA-binding protein [Paenibacillus phyllosphaerae]
MLTNRYEEIDEVIAYIHRHLDEPLPLQQLANHVAYSPFHFTRIFKERMGLTPHYYISSLRLQRAKELLIQTDMSVRDIGLEIGQQSMGTFSTRFTERVGMTPTEFRNAEQHTADQFKTLHQLVAGEASPLPTAALGTLRGTIRSEIPFQGVIWLGLFAKPIPEGLPVYGTLLFSLGEFSLSNLKPGTYYLMATSASWGTEAVDILLPHTSLRARSAAPVVVRANTPIAFQDVVLSAPRTDDPPILISLPLLMNQFLTRFLQRQN